MPVVDQAFCESLYLYIYKLWLNPYKLQISSPIHIYWTSPFSILGLFSGIFRLYFDFDRSLWKQNVRFAASDLVLYCLSMYYKLDAMLIWINRITNISL